MQLFISACRNSVCLIHRLQNINENHLKILKKISCDVPNEDGFLTMKTSPNNTLENVIYYNHSTSKLINYNIVNPSNLELEEKIESAESATNIDLVPPKRKIGRPRKEDKKIMETYNNMYTHFGHNPLNQDVLIHRTKYGRSIKFNSDVAKMLQIDPQIIHKSPQVHVPESIKRIAAEPLEELDRPKKQRVISSEFRCATCKKVYLGKNKMNHHLKLNPSHRVFSLESDLFSHLMKLVRQKKKNNEMANVFFKELSSFVQQCEKFTPKLITNNENHPNVHHHIIDKNAASVLRINPGEYKINMNVFDKHFKFDSSPPDQVIHDEEEIRNVSIEEDHQDNIERVVPGNEVIKVLDDVPSLDGNLLLIPQTNELTHLTNISDIDIITNSEHEDNALLGFLH